MIWQGDAMTRLLMIPILLAASPALCQSGMSADEFEAYTRDKTLFYAFEGEAYGVEQYLDDRRVIWSFLDGRCKEGTWYEEAGHICFVYEDRLDAQCWKFSESPGGLVAQFKGEPGETELYEAQEGRDEMVCYGPDVGV